MEETITRAVNALKEAFSGYSFTDQAYMFDRAAGLCLEAMDECLEIKYGYTSKELEQWKQQEF
jgi:hypothetical protein